MPGQKRPHALLAFCLPTLPSRLERGRQMPPTFRFRRRQTLHYPAKQKAKTPAFPIACRVRRKRQRLRSNGLIESAASSLRRSLHAFVQAALPISPNVFQRLSQKLQCRRRGDKLAIGMNRRWLAWTMWALPLFATEQAPAMVAGTYRGVLVQ